MWICGTSIWLNYPKTKTRLIGSKPKLVIFLVIYLRHLSFIEFQKKKAQMSEQTMTQDPDQLLNEIEAANLIGFSVRALQNWRHRGGGPAYVNPSKRAVRYRRRDLLSWIDSNTVANTSEATLRHGA